MKTNEQISVSGIEKNESKGVNKSISEFAARTELTVAELLGVQDEVSANSEYYTDDMTSEEKKLSDELHYMENNQNKIISMASVLENMDTYMTV